MNLELSEEQLALRDTVRRFLAEKAPISGRVRALLDDPTGTTEAVWRGLAELGTTGLLVPPEYGGAGMTMVEAGVVAEELGAALHRGPGCPQRSRRRGRCAGATPAPPRPRSSPG